MENRGLYVSVVREVVVCEDVPAHRCAGVAHRENGRTGEFRREIVGDSVRAEGETTTTYVDKSITLYHIQGGHP